MRRIMATDRKLKAICGWMRPKRAEDVKASIAEIMEIDANYSESRVVNEALAEYIPKLLRRFGIEKVERTTQNKPAQENSVGGHA